mmetsp:Transcript_22162/g.45030  ORF Transcript_22162/g.45030 Transcript_22162/m.45030 type:complete len:258 (+) Transcript_22162:552-1325(+)
MIVVWQALHVRCSQTVSRGQPYDRQENLLPRTKQSNVYESNTTPKHSTHTHLLRNIPRILIKQHLILRIPQSLHIRIDVRRKNLTKRRQTRLVDESIPGKQKRRIGRIPVTHPQRTSRLHIVRGRGVVIPIVVVTRGDFGVVRSVIEVISEGYQFEIAVGRFEGAGVDHLEGPGAEFFVPDGVVGEEGDASDGELAEEAAFFHGEFLHEGGKAFVAEGGHGGGVGVVAGEGVEPVVPRGVLSLFVLDQDFQHEVEVA